MKNAMSDGKGNRLVNGNKIADGRPPKSQKGPETSAERRERLKQITGRAKPKPEPRPMSGDGFTTPMGFKVTGYGPAYALGDDGKWRMISPGYKVDP